MEKNYITVVSFRAYDIEIKEVFIDEVMPGMPEITQRIKKKCNTAMLNSVTWYHATVQNKITFDKKSLS